MYDHKSHILVFHEIPINIRQRYINDNEKILFSFTRTGVYKGNVFQEWYFFTTKHLVYMRRDEELAMREISSKDLLEYHVYGNDIVLSCQDESIRIELDENNHAETMMKEVSKYWNSPLKIKEIKL